MKWFKTKHIDLSDAELLIKLKEEPDKWTPILYSRYLELIYGVCLKYYKEPEKSKDATMALYGKFADKVVSHKVDNFKSWLYVLVKNDCLEKLRKSTRLKEKIKEHQIMQSEDIFHPYSEDQKEDTLVKLETCIEKLNADQKICIELFYLKKKTYQEISQSMKLEWNKVRSLIQNGRRNLKNCIEST